jgi:hypothetical protein
VITVCLNPMPLSVWNAYSGVKSICKMVFVKGTLELGVPWIPARRAGLWMCWLSRSNIFYKIFFIYLHHDKKNQSSTIRSLWRISSRSTC